ncbi:hypothetical protein F4818DRAFT_412337 [Hypoxylon cercidicola]|nr:hypothetical protein F4818DRAFT_412337 [Hypoxylon cercidicola]
MPGNVAHPVYSSIASSSQESWRPGRRYGKCDFGRFEPLLGSNHYLGRGNIGDVEVACRFLFRESRWGILTSDKNPGGVLYLDLIFTEPAGCRLRDATVVLTLNEEDISLRGFNAESSDPYDSISEARVPKARIPKARVPVHITQHGPQILRGPLEEVSKVTRNYVSPWVDVGGIIGAGGVGRDSEKHSVHRSQWTFSSLAMPNKSGKSTILQWHLIESELDRQPRHDNTFHTGFAFEHDGQPFFIQVEIDGHLDGMASHLWNKTKQRWNKLKFPAEPQFARTLVNFRGRNNPYRSPLDELARSIPQAMNDKNMKLMPQVPEHSPNRETRFEEGPATEQDGGLQGRPLLSQTIDVPSPAAIEEIQEIGEKAVALFFSGRGAMTHNRSVQMAETLSRLKGHGTHNDSRFSTRNSAGSSTTTPATALNPSQDELVRKVALVQPNEDLEKFQNLLKKTAVPAIIQLLILWIMAFSMKVSKVPSPSKKGVSPRGEKAQN